MSVPHDVARQHVAILREISNHEYGCENPALARRSIVTQYPVVAVSSAAVTTIRIGQRPIHPATSNLPGIQVLTLASRATIRYRLIRMSALGLTR